MGTRSSFVVFMLSFVWRSAVANDWVQFGYDAAHSNFNRCERGYPTANGNAVLWHFALPATAYVAPVFLSGVSTSTGVRDVLFVVEIDGTLLALDANSSSADVLWSHEPAGAGLKTAAGAAIDPGRQYVYAYALDGKVH